MKDEPFVADTNILVYAFDESEPEKRKACKALIANVFSGNAKGMVTNQNLAELFYVLTCKIEKPIAGDKAATIVEGFVQSDNWLKLNYSHKTVVKAAKSSSGRGIHFWDALIAETALENGVYVIYTENVKDFKEIKGIRVLSPF